MIDPSDAQKVLQKLFENKPVVDLEMLCRTLKTSSRMSVFRRLKEVGYRTSYTHRGSLYALTDIPQFDDRGLWFCQGVGFSRYGTLINSVANIVHNSEVGYTHRELEDTMRIKVHNTLLGLIRRNRIARKRIDTMYLYVSAESSRASEQMRNRQDRDRGPTAHLDEIPKTLILEVLLEVMHGSKVTITTEAVTRRLFMRGVSVRIEQVESVFEHYKIKQKKKTPQSVSKR